MADIEGHAPGTFSWADLISPDLTRAREFYGKVLGWTFVVSGPETGHYSMAQVRGRNAAGLGLPPPGHSMPSVWTPYFASAKLEETIAKITAQGGTVVTGPMDVMDEGRLAICADPTGAHFGLWEARRHHGARVANEPGAMAWCEVNSRDAARARDFYAAVFGLDARKLEAPGMEYWTLHKGEQTVGGVHQMGAQFPAGVPSHWSVYFEVASADAAATQITEGGGTVMGQPFDTGYGRMVFAQDPFGARFCVNQPLTPSR